MVPVAGWIFSCYSKLKHFGPCGCRLIRLMSQFEDQVGS